MKKITLVTLALIASFTLFNTVHATRMPGPNQAMLVEYYNSGDQLIATSYRACSGQTSWYGDPTGFAYRQIFWEPCMSAPLTEKEIASCMNEYALKADQMACMEIKQQMKER